jgi:hypothetical protein
LVMRIRMLSVLLICLVVLRCTGSYVNEGYVLKLKIVTLYVAYVAVAAELVAEE